MYQRKLSTVGVYVFRTLIFAIVEAAPRQNIPNIAETSLGSKWTKNEMIDIIRDHGYTVKEGSDGTVFVLIGDVLAYPHLVLPDLASHSSRRNLLRHRLWLNDAGIAQVNYFFDTKTNADQHVFEKAVSSWGSSTCIKFTKLAPRPCGTDLGHAAVCVGNFSGCFSLMGRQYGPGMKSSQQMSVEPRSCEMAAAAHEFGHTLGLSHEMARADRDDYIRVNFENIDVPLTHVKNERYVKAEWFQGAKCAPGQMYDAPKPYDPMSLMQYGTSDFAKEDSRPVYFSLNAKYQYMFDYHRPSGLVQTHYDKYIVNLGYRCVKQWRQACEKNGTPAPICRNYGYLTQECTCACPVGYSGVTCSTVSGPMFPVQDRAQAQVDVTEPGVVEMAGKGMKDDGTYLLESFLQYQFIGIYITANDGSRIHVQALHNFSKIAETYDASQDFWIKSAHESDCQYGLQLFVAGQAAGMARTECRSSVLNNEHPTYAPVFVSKHHTLNMTGIGSWALTPDGEPATTRKAMEFIFVVKFLEKPEVALIISPQYPGMLAAMVHGVSQKLRKNKGTVIGVTIALILLIGIIVAVVLYLRRKQNRGDELSESKTSQVSHINTEDAKVHMSDTPMIDPS